MRVDLQFQLLVWSVPTFSTLSNLFPHITGHNTLPRWLIGYTAIVHFFEARFANILTRSPVMVTPNPIRISLFFFDRICSASSAPKQVISAWTRCEKKAVARTAATQKKIQRYVMVRKAKLRFRGRKYSRASRARLGDMFSRRLTL